MFFASNLTYTIGGRTYRAIVNRETGEIVAWAADAPAVAAAMSNPRDAVVVAVANTDDFEVVAALQDAGYPQNTIKVLSP